MAKCIVEYCPDDGVDHDDYPGLCARHANAVREKKACASAPASDDGDIYVVSGATYQSGMSFPFGASLPMGSDQHYTEFNWRYRCASVSSPHTCNSCGQPTSVVRNPVRP